MQLRMPVPALIGRNFRARLHAWWEGYDFAPPEAEAVEAERPAPAKGKTGTKPSSRDQWPRERIEIAQMLWGPEFVSPLGELSLSALVTPLAPQADVSLMHLGCGLGGGTRALVHEFGVKATGLEPCATLAKLGMELSIEAKLKTQAPIDPVDLARGEMKPNAFLLALVEHVLHTVDDKEGALQRIVHTLKPGARLLILDFAAQGKAPGPAVAAWAAADPLPVKPWSLDAARKALAKLNIEVSEVTDETERLCADLMHGLDVFLKGAETQPLTPPLTVALKREVDLWLARKAALDTGEVKMLAIRGVKKG